MAGENEIRKFNGECVHNGLVGTQNFKFEGATNTLTAGSYRDIIVEKNSRLVVEGGIYNLRKLELKNGAVLIFNASTTINIKVSLRGHDKVSILPGLNVQFDSLTINYSGIKKDTDDEENEDDEDSAEETGKTEKTRKKITNFTFRETDTSPNTDETFRSGSPNPQKKENPTLPKASEWQGDDDDREDDKNGTKSIIFGKQSFLNFKLLAPKASIHIGMESTMRGQILARRIKIDKESVLGRDITTIKEFDPTKVIRDSVNSIYPTNEIIINFSADAVRISFEFHFFIVSAVNGVIL